MRERGAPAGPLRGCQRSVAAPGACQLALKTGAKAAQAAVEIAQRNSEFSRAQEILEDAQYCVYGPEDHFVPV